MNLDFHNMLSDSLLNQMSNILILFTTMIVFIFRFLSFINASNVEKHLENKISKMFREFYLYNLLFLFFFLISLNFSPGIFSYSTAFFVITLIFFILNMLIIRYNKSKFPLKIFSFRKVINLKKLRPFLIVINIITVLLFYVIVASAMAISIKSKLKLDSVFIYNIIIDTFKSDIYYAISYIIACYIAYSILRVYLLPVIVFYNSISPSYLVEIHLTNNEILQYVTLIESFNDYYVFSSIHSDKNRVDDKIIVPKDKIQYIKFLSTNDTSMICK